LEEGDVGASWPPSDGQGFAHYLITRREPSGFEAPHAFFRNGEGVVAVFCSEGAARRYLASLAPEDGWHVRVFSAGELISLLFALHERVAWVLPDPLPNPSPGRLPPRDRRSCPVRRDDFIGSLLGR